MDDNRKVSLSNIAFHKQYEIQKPATYRQPEIFIIFIILIHSSGCPTLLRTGSGGTQRGQEAAGRGDSGVGRTGAPLCPAAAALPGCCAASCLPTRAA